MARQTPLYRLHQELGARMVDFGGWDMPVQYSGIIEEHNVVRTAVGLFDVSHMGEIEIRGPEAARLTDYVTTNGVAKLKTGQIHYSGLLYDHGGFVDDILVHKVADDHYFLCVNASNQEKDFEHIAAHNKFDARVDFTSNRYVQLAIQGPRARDTLQKLTQTDLSTIEYYHFADGQVSGTPARIARTGYTGEDGFEIYVPTDEATSARVWNEVLEAGKDLGGETVPEGHAPLPQARAAGFGYLALERDPEKCEAVFRGAGDKLGDLSQVVPSPWR